MRFAYTFAYDCGSGLYQLSMSDNVTSRTEMDIITIIGVKHEKI